MELKMGEVERSPNANRYNTAEMAEQQRRCYELRLAHYTIPQIAEMTGLAVGTVYNRLTTHIDETVTPYKEQYRVLQRERLERISRAVLDTLNRAHYLVSEGRVVKGPDGQPLVDDEFTLKCLDRLMKAHDQLAKLEGTNAPTRVEATVTNNDPQDVELAAMIREANAKSAAEEARIRGAANGG